MPSLLSRSAFSLALLTFALAGCHTIRSYEDTTRGDTTYERRAEPPRALPPRLELTDDGRFRFIEPLVCGRDAITELEIARVDRRSPNAAALVVGVIATAIGAVALVNGTAGDDPAGSPLTYVGPVAIAGGLPFVIGPLIGNRTSRSLLGVQQLRAPSEDERCGERPVAATRATLGWSGLRAVGAVDADGGFAVSPFEFVDAFDVADAPPLALTIAVERAGNRPLALDAVIDKTALARAAPGFLARIGIDATIEPIRKVPRLEPGALILHRGGPPGARVLELSLPLANAGPGDAFAVRLILSSPHPELDGRVLYAGRIAAHTDRAIAGALALSDDADRALATDELVLSARLRDAHDAAPETPIRFRGRVSDR